MCKRRITHEGFILFIPIVIIIQSTEIIIKSPNFVIKNYILLTLLHNASCRSSWKKNSSEIPAHGVYRTFLSPAQSNCQIKHNLIIVTMRSRDYNYIRCSDFIAERNLGTEKLNASLQVLFNHINFINAKLKR